MKKIFTLLFLFCISFQINKAQSLFCDDFENGMNGWIASSPSGNVWQLDTFSIGFTPNHIWDIGLYTGYAANTVAYLYSPIFNSPVTFNYSLCFWHQFYTEIYEDGTRLEYTMDGGLTWQIIGTGGLATWYNCYFITSSGNLPGWSGSSPVWTQAFYNLGSISSVSIQFRFVFTSGINSNLTGNFLIDNFCLCNGISCNCSLPLVMEEPKNNVNELTIIPNPASFEFQISNFNFQKDDQLIFSNALGKILFTKKIESPISNLKLQTSSFSNGIYFLELKTKDGALNKKVVVER